MIAARLPLLSLVVLLACRAPRQPEVAPDDATVRAADRALPSTSPPTPDAGAAPDPRAPPADGDVASLEEVTLAQVLRSSASWVIRDPARRAAAFDPADYARTPATDPSSELPHAALIPLPPLSPDVATRAEALRGDALRALRCFTEFSRASHPAVPECPAVGERLARGGAAAVHALGRAAYDGQVGRLSPEELRLTATWGTDGFTRVITWGNYQAAAEFATAIVRRLDDAAAVPYVLDLLVRPLGPMELDAGHGGAEALRL